MFRDFRTKYRRSFLGGSSRLLVGGGTLYSAKLQALFGSSIVGYWQLGEASGSASLDSGPKNHPGVYTGVTLGQPGIGDGRTAMSDDGATSFNNVFSAGLASDFNGAAGSMFIWGKVSAAGVWTDGADRQLVELLADVGNRITLAKVAAGNAVLLRYRANSISVSVTAALTVTNYFTAALTWNKAGDAVKAYINGVQSGATQTGLGLWAGALTTANIGAFSTVPVQVWSGLLAHALLLNRDATAAEVAKFNTVP